MTEDQFEEFMEKMDSRLTVKELKVLRTKRKNILFKATLLVYGVQTLERATQIWSRWDKKKREEMGLRIETATIYQGSTDRDFLIQLRGEIQKEALK